MKRETYSEARLRLFRELSSLGFEVKVKDARNFKPLKIPQVKLMGFHPDSRTLYFHSQAIYMDELSTGLDIRGMSADTLLAIVTEIHRNRLKIGR